MNKELRKIVKGLAYSKLMKGARFLYRKKKTETNSKKLIEYVNNIEKPPKKNTIRIAFILKFPEIWNSVKTVYESFNKKENIELFIIAVKQGDNNNPAFSFAKAFCNNVIDWNDAQFKYEALGIDYVFFTRPYDKDYPLGLKPNYICQYSKICYIPYGFEFVTGYHIEVEYDYSFLPYASMIFCEGDSSYNYCRKILPNNAYTKLFRLGFPRFDLLKQYTAEASKKNLIMWTPRWSLERLANDGTSFFSFIEPLISFFSTEEMKDFSLVIRPHPLMFNNFIKNNVMTEDQVTEIKDRISKCKNISFDENVNYLDTASQSDLIISDFSGMLIEFLMMNKPIIYCGRTNSFDEIGDEMSKIMYHINDEFDIVKSVKDYFQHGDFLKRQRETFINDMGLNGDVCVGEKIAGVILRDIRRVENE